MIITEMLPIIFSIGPITVYSFGFLLALGFLVGAFIIWRRLKDLGLDEEKIIDLIILGTIVGLVFSKIPEFSFFGSLTGFFLVLWWFTKKEKWDFWLIVDELAYGILPFFILVQIGAFLGGSNPGKSTTMPWGVYFPGTLVRTQPTSLFLALGFFLILLFLLKIERNWRTWDWYKSKAPGFIFLLFLGLTFLVNLLIAFLSNDKLYWLWLKVIFNSVGTIAAGLILFYRSGRWNIYGKEKKTQ